MIVMCSMRRILALSILAFPLLACSQTKTISWKEEVRLSSGQVIVAERSQDYRSVYAGGSLEPGWLFDFERIRIAFPPPIGEISWEGRLKPIALDISSSSQIFLVAAVATVAGQKEYGIPNGSYHVAFSYEDRKWRRIPIASVPRDIRVNMLVDSRTLFIRPDASVSYVDLGLKKKVDSDPRIVKWYRDWPRQ